METLKIIFSYGKNQVSSELTCSNLESYIQGNAKSLHYYIKNNSDPYNNGIIIGDNELKLQKNFKAYFVPSKELRDEILKPKNETSKVSNKKITFSKLLELHNSGKITATEFETAVQKLHG